ncbi:prostaglandin D2 receptor 2 [Kryptolebias marmoratus]|uniref:prostaglandin D2 receptor 2 n=1 Tax=Kryptolebias marmoratus TaxID=37003 RepID=UPI0007F90AF9|nr:prostaglandin D2 receptor 2 [Kryptolebias marmoratus]
MTNMTLNMTDPYCPLINRMRNHTSNTTGRNWMVVSIHGLVSCLGILENALIIWVLGFRLRKHTVICIWVLNLSLSDFLACLTLPLFTAYLYHSQSWVLGNALCTAQSSVFYFNMFVSAFLLSVISLDRLLLVVKPVWSKNHRSVAGAWKVCALGWLWAVINTLPYSVFRSVIEKNDGKKLCYHNFALYLSTNKSLETECYMRQAATAISKILFAFLFPLVIITASYIKLTLKLKEVDRKRKESNSWLSNTLVNDEESGGKKTPSRTKINNFFIKTFTSDSSSKVNLNTVSPKTSAPSQLSKSFTKMVAFVIVSFTLLWAPYHILCMMEVTAEKETMKEIYTIVETWLPLAATFSFLNPVLNPVLYAFSCPQFCMKIRQNLAAVFEGLVEERGGLLGVPRRNVGAQESQDVGF